MPRYIIERNVPGVHRLNAEALKNLAQRSNQVLAELGPEIQWIQSYVGENKLYCVYTSPSEQLIQEHAKRGPFPLESVSQVKTIIDPGTGA